MDHHIFPDTHKFLYKSCFHYERRISCFDDNPINNCQGKRYLQVHGAAFTRRTFYFQHTADSLQILDYHIHTHAAPGIFRYLLISGESRQCDKLVNFLIAISRIRLSFFQNPLLPCFL